MNAVARDIFTSVTTSKRCCYKCGRRWPIADMKVKRTPAGGAIYTGPCCAPKPGKAVR
jgi:hypothetical protein